MSSVTAQLKDKFVRDESLDAVKGFLILCIVLEHNSLLTSQYDWIRAFCDSFAAGTFLVLTFLRPLQVKSFASFADKHLSYLVPFIIFTVVLAVSNFIMFNDSSFLSSLVLFLKAIFIASPAGIKESTGFTYIWFLPCLIALYSIRYLHLRLGHFLTFSAFAVFLIIGEVDSDVLENTPYSLHVIAFIYILGVIYANVHHRVINGNILVKLFFVILFILLCFSTSLIGWKLFLAGGIIPSWREPFILIYYAVFHVIAIPSIYIVFTVLPIKFTGLFALLGQKSLLVYLLHPILFYALFKIGNLNVSPLVSLFITIIGSYFLAVIIDKMSAIKNIVFPNKISSLFSNTGV